MRDAFFSSLMHVAPHASSRAQYVARNIAISRLLSDAVSEVVEIFIILCAFRVGIAGYEKFLTLGA